MKGAIVENNDQEQSREHWTIDRKIPIAIIVTILLQTGYFVSWGSRIDNRVEVLERGAVTAAPQGDRLVRLETQYDAIRESLAEIKVLIRRSKQDGQ